MGAAPAATLTESRPNSVPRVQVDSPPVRARRGGSGVCPTAAVGPPPTAWRRRQRQRVKMGKIEKRCREAAIGAVGGAQGLGNPGAKVWSGLTWQRGQDYPFVANSLSRVLATSLSSRWGVKTFPLVARSSFFMSSLRTPKPRPEMTATTSNRGLPRGDSLVLIRPDAGCVSPCPWRCRRLGESWRRSRSGGYDVWSVSPYANTAFDFPQRQGTIGPCALKGKLP